jgi:hypothetical protein
LRGFLIMLTKSVNKRRGRPAGRDFTVGVRMQPDQLTALDAWIARQPEPQPSRPEAIRHLAQMSLAGSEAAPDQSQDIVEEALTVGRPPQLKIDDVE